MKNAASRNYRSFNRWLEAHATLLGAWASIASLIGVPVLLFGLFQIRDYFMQPDVVLEFYALKQPLVRLANTSKAVARDVRYQLSLWDLDKRANSTGSDPGNLEITVKTIDYIRPGSAIGPWSIESLAAANIPIPSGHVIFGIALVQCPDCVRQRSYWLYLKKEETGWISEISNEESLTLMGPFSRILKAGTEYQQVIDDIVPLKKRVSLATK